MAGSDPVLTAIVDVITETATEIRNGLAGRRGMADEENPSGETQAEADIWADDLLYERLAAIDGVGEFASEERADVIDCGSDANADAYTVTIDPLDGSSNLKSNNTMGTIFAVYDDALPAKGESLVAGGFTLFGPITTMMVATEAGVTEYEVSDGERTVVDDSVSVPDEPTVYGFGGRVPDWTDEFTSFAREIEDEYKLRYGGSMIGDVNQTLSYGGIFAYPTLESSPQGKLRLQFEGNPMAYVVEQAGGRSSNGEQSLLAVDPEDVHERTPIYLGNDALVDRVEDALN